MKACCISLLLPKVIQGHRDLKQTESHLGSVVVR